jgi:hypothetical protein
MKTITRYARDTVLFLLTAVMLVACTENYANGERIGLVTQFSRAGLIWKSWEGHLNLTQTGMNSASTAPFDFSIDNDKEDPTVVAAIDSAANLGWKVKLTYHQASGKNWLSNRGETNHFITGVQILDRTPVSHLLGGTSTTTASSGHTVDTIYVVIVGKASESARLTQAVRP